MNNPVVIRSFLGTPKKDKNASLAQKTTKPVAKRKCSEVKKLKNKKLPINK